MARTPERRRQPAPERQDPNLVCDREDLGRALRWMIHTAGQRAKPSEDRPPQSEAELAAKLKVSRQQVNKYVQGRDITPRRWDEILGMLHIEGPERGRWATAYDRVQHHSKKCKQRYEPQGPSNETKSPDALSNHHGLPAVSESPTVVAPRVGAEDVADSRGARWANRPTRMTLLAVAGGLVVVAVGLILLLSPEAEVSTPLVASHSGKCVSITGDVMADGAKVQQHTCTGGPGRTWRLERVGEELADGAALRIVGVDSGRCLTFSEERFGGARVIVQQTCDPASDAQEWRFVIEEQRSGSSYGQLINMRGGTCLDINGGSVDVDTPVVLWTCGDQRNQRFGVADEAVS